jgi:5-methylcytosine-specific restriction endonuclease McrA
MRQPCKDCWKEDGRRRDRGYKNRPVSVAEKTCPHCGATKPSSMYFRFRAKPDGLSSWCKECVGAKNREWERTHRDTKRKLTNAWQHKNHAHYRELQKKYFRSDKGLLAGYRKRAWRHGSKLLGTHTADEWNAKCEQYGMMCASCRENKPLTRDHIVPISKGGGNSIDNIQPLCRACNTRKKDKTIHYAPQPQLALV